MNTINEILDITLTYDTNFNVVSMGTRQGKYFIDRTNYFLMLDTLGCMDKCPLGIGEKPEPCSMFRVDIDYKETSTELHPLYTENILLNHIYTIQSFLNTYTQNTDCLVLTKKPYKKNENTISHGIHLQFINLFIDKDIFMFFEDKLSSIVDFKYDKIRNTPWLLYPCSKGDGLEPYTPQYVINNKKEKIDLQTYFSTYKIYNQREQLIDIDTNKIQSYMTHILSIRPNNREYTDIVIPQVIDGTFGSGGTKTKQIKENKPKVQLENINYDNVYKMLDSLNNTRWEVHEHWRNLIFLLVSINVPNDKIHDYSERGGDKYDMFGTQKLIDDFNPDKCSITLGTLGFYYKEDTGNKPLNTTKYMTTDMTTELTTDMTITDTDEIIYDMIKKDDDYYWVDFEREYIGKVFDNLSILKKGIKKDLPRVLGKILYGKGFYVKKEHKDDLCNMVSFPDMNRIIFTFNEQFVNKKGIRTDTICKIKLDEMYLDCKLPLYSHYDFILDTKNLNPNVYNGYKGINSVKVDYIDYERIEKFKKHLREVICNDDVEVYHFFLSWMRWIMVHPEIKSKIFPMLYSGFGYGKSTIGEFLYKYIFGEISSYTCSGLDGLTRHFNKHLCGKIFCMVEELPSTTETFHTQFDKMKNLITDSRFEMTRKGVDSLNVNNYLNFLGCSNNKFALKINQGDERYFVIEIKKKMNSDYWTDYYKNFQNQEFGNMLYSYFLTTKDDDYIDFRGRPKIPITEIKQEIIDFSLPTYEKFYKDIKDGIYQLPETMFREPFTYKGKEYKYSTSIQHVYEEYLNWGSINGERDLKRKYLVFKQHKNDKFRFIDLQEIITNIDELELKKTGRILEL